MNKTNKTLALVVAGVLALPSSLLALGGRKAEYVGGTMSSIPDNTEGVLDTRNDTTLSFVYDGNKGSFAIPYEAITSLEYGQHAGKRIVASVLFVLPIFSKKRAHYLTVTYRDLAGKEQACVLELGKDIVRTTLTIVETRSGTKIDYEDEEAAKAGRGK